MAAEVVKATCPGSTALVDPAARLIQAARVEAVDAALRLAAHLHEPRPQQHRQVSRHGGARDREPRCDVTRVEVQVAQHLHDLGSDRVGECGEGLHAIM